jgi:hypothetical protein
MDSALECLTFAINALGYCVDPSGFRDVANPKALNQIRTKDIYGEKLLSGYTKIFPELQKLWLTSAMLIERVTELHDVSKHREAIFSGGQFNLEDVHDGFYEKIGTTEGVIQTFYQPFQRIVLDKAPKIPKVLKQPFGWTEHDTLEYLVGEYMDFIGKSLDLAFQEATANIPLQVNQLQ